MSNTYNIHCDTCKMSMWYGQSSGGRKYAYKREGIEPIVEFLFEHGGHKLHSSDDYSGNEGDVDGYKRIDLESYYK